MCSSKKGMEEQRKEERKEGEGEEGKKGGEVRCLNLVKNSLACELMRAEEGFKEREDEEEREVGRGSIK